MDAVSRGNLANIFKNLYEDRDRADRSQDPSKVFVEEKEKRLELALNRKTFRSVSIQHWYEAESQIARQEYEDGKVQLQEDLEKKIKKKISDLKRKHEQFKSCCKWSSSVKMKLRKRRKKASSIKPHTVNGPYIVYMLKDEEISEDLEVIRSSLNTDQEE